MRRNQIKAYVDELCKGPFSDATAVKISEFEDSFTEEEWDYFLDLIKKKDEYYQNHPNEWPEVIG